MPKRRNSSAHKQKYASARANKEKKLQHLLLRTYCARRVNKTLRENGLKKQVSACCRALACSRTGALARGLQRVSALNSLPSSLERAQKQLRAQAR
jgi:hypothetical protein